MYQVEPFTGGASLPPKTLCLTYDDGPGATEGTGPGPRTLELATYLHEEGIAATFFMVGRHARELPLVAGAVRRLGHLVANHTDSHRSLPAVLAADGESGVVAEILSTDEALGPSMGGVVYVRAPYGDWSADVALALNQSVEASVNHVGPIHWDVTAEDWHHWGRGSTPEECAAAYLDAIESAGQGVVLMHDCTADPNDEGVRFKALNRTFELTLLLVPELKRRGYTFVRLDEIAAIHAAESDCS